MTLDVVPDLSVHPLVNIGSFLTLGKPVHHDFNTHDDKGPSGAIRLSSAYPTHTYTLNPFPASAYSAGWVAGH